MIQPRLVCTVLVALFLTGPTEAQVVNPGVELLSCEEIGDDTEFAWQNPTTYSSIEVWRNMGLLATLPGDSEAYVDLQSAGQDHQYLIRAYVDGVATLPRQCELDTPAVLTDLRGRGTLDPGRPGGR